jgi:cell division protein FtsL
MNAAARQAAAHYGAPFWEGIVLSPQGIKCWLFLILFLISGLSVVYEKEIYRSHLAESQRLTQVNHELRVQAKQLLLEQTAWGASSRVQEIAERRLKMHGIEQKSVFMVRL